MAVQTGDKVLIGGFIINGSDPKRVLIRGMGPSLKDFGVNKALADPMLELHFTDGSVIPNDNCKINDQTSQSQEADIRVTNLAPSNELESAILVTLKRGAYTAILSGKGQTTGVGLVEVYDVSPSTNSKVANISTRGFADTGDNVMIGGFIVAPLGSGNSTMVIRAIGPSLGQFGVSNPLPDPRPGAARRRWRDLYQRRLAERPQCRAHSYEPSSNRPA